jgi:hypothetical protein
VSRPFVARCADRYSQSEAEQYSDICEAASLLSLTILFEGKCRFHRQGYKVRHGPWTLTDLDENGNTFVGNVGNQLHSNDADIALQRRIPGQGDARRHAL